ncbi:hypothetical protein [Brucella melitensis]|uniref:hypothetical protein n=1 Tax=Brucella melitensis TaxID=29459 RepID=UPI0032BF8943
MTDEHLSELLASEIADFFANVEELTMSIGGPANIAAAQQMLFDRVMMVVLESRK